MPEGPEVETIVRGLKPLVGAQVTGMRTEEVKGLIKNCDEIAFQAKFLGTTLKSVDRFGKWISFGFHDPVSDSSHPILLSHLGMFGTWLVSRDKLAPSPRHTRLRFDLSTPQGPCSLTYVDMRSWGKLYGFSRAEAIQFLRGRVGVDATVVTLSQLRYFLRTDTRPVVEILLDQSKIAGLGNIYRSEVLWHSCIAPDRPGTDITEEESEVLWRSIRSVIAKAIELRGSSIRDYRDTNGNAGEFHKFLRAYGHEGLPCTRCNVVEDQSMTIVRTLMPLIISTKKFDDRSAFYCPSCQK